MNYDLNEKYSSRQQQALFSRTALYSLFPIFFYKKSKSVLTLEFIELVIQDITFLVNVNDVTYLTLIKYR